MSKMPLPSKQQCVVWMKALADPLRIRILQCIFDSPQSVTDIAKRIGRSITNTSHHLQVLRHAELVAVEKAGRSALYRIDRDACRQCLRNEMRSLDFGCCLLHLDMPDC